MMGRTKLAFVVLDMGYVQNKIFTAESFYTLKLTAFFLNIAVPVSIRFWRPFYEDTKRCRLNFGGHIIELPHSDNES